MKKWMMLILVFTLLSSSLVDSHGEDFAKKEDHYIKLCSSSLTLSHKKTCQSFNDYLKKKNATLAKSISSQESDLKKTKSDLKSIAKKINTLEDKIVKLENEIHYIESSITKLQTQINHKNTLIGKRLYAMQSVYNSDSYITYVFTAKTLPDIFSRVASLTQLTSYEEDLEEEIQGHQKELKTQRASLTSTQAALTLKKAEAKKLQARAVKLKAKQELALSKAKDNKDKLTAAQASINASLEAMISSDTTSTVNYTGGVGEGSETGKKIASTALTKLGARYWWTKTGPDYFDCSGFVYWVHNKAGISVPRMTAAGYSKAGLPVSAASLSAGDIITFTYGSGVSHVGIYLGNGKFVHASGKGSGTVGQDPNQCVKVSSLSGRWLSYVYNYRRLY